MNAFRTFTVAAVISISSFIVNGQNSLSPDTAAKIDKIAAEALASSGVPSASVAVVKDGRIAYLKAYGTARLETKTAAAPKCVTVSARSASSLRPRRY